MQKRIQEFKVLNKFAKNVIRIARIRLARNEMNATKDLANSLKYYLKLGKITSIKFFGLDYWYYQDQGVKGTKSSYIQNTKTKAKYKETSNLIGLEAKTGTFAAFAKRKGMQPRNKKGQFGSYKTMGFILANSIKQKGIPANFFFSKALDKGLESLPQEYAKSIVRDNLTLTKK